MTPLGMFVVFLAALVTLYGAEAILVHRLSSRAPDLYKAIGSPRMFDRWPTFVRPLAKRIQDGDPEALSHGIPRLLPVVRSLRVTWYLLLITFAVAVWL
jgi:hypothetical protein